MAEHTTDEGQERAPNAAAADGPYLVAELVLSRDRPAECTLYPLAADDFERMTVWMSAEEGSFVSLEEME
jgi:hypothetical protein